MQLDNFYSDVDEHALIRFETDQEIIVYWKVHQNHATMKCFYESITS